MWHAPLVCLGGPLLECLRNPLRIWQHGLAAGRAQRQVLVRTARDVLELFVTPADVVEEDVGRHSYTQAEVRLDQNAATSLTSGCTEETTQAEERTVL